jgi:DinB superfamily
LKQYRRLNYKEQMMDCKDAVKKTFETSDFLVQAYLGDLTAQEMLVRPLPSVNHVAWQFGHLISAERQLVEAAAPGSMPKLPDGFAERHNKGTAGSDKPGDFLSKEEYFKVAKDIRAGTLAALEKLSAADLDKPVTGNVPPFVKRAGDSFLTAASHWGMHAGQWVVLRRKLGRPVQF